MKPPTTKPMTMEQWWGKVFKQAKKHRCLFRIPGYDDLQLLFKAGRTPQEVIDLCK